MHPNRAMSSIIAERLVNFREKLGKGVKLVAVSKTFPAQDIAEAMEAGHLDFGENRVQEVVQKSAVLPQTLRWHQLGHLQSNKVKALVPIVCLIHSVDSLRIFNAIAAEAQKIGKSMDVLLQVHIAEEEAKTGFSAEELLRAWEARMFEHPNVSVKGLMGIATNTNNSGQVRSEFRRLFRMKEQLGLAELSMGMSLDWEIAVEEGSTMVRIGSAIFGNRG